MSRLPNYLISHRKRLSLSQRDVAFLLGMSDSAQVSRYEQFLRKPSLETALAFEAILQKPMSEIFKGLYVETQKEVASRAKVLTYRIESQKTAMKRGRRRETLANIINYSMNQDE